MLRLNGRIGKTTETCGNPVSQKPPKFVALAADQASSGKEPVEESAVKIYGTPPTRLLRVLWVTNELGLDYEAVPIDLQKGEGNSPAYLAVNPTGKVPALVDGSVTLTESAAMQLYLAEKHPEAGLIPQSLADRAQMYRWHFFLMTEIEAPLWRMALHEFVYDEADRDPAEIKRAAADCSRMLAVLE